MPFRGCPNLIFRLVEAPEGVVMTRSFVIAALGVSLTAVAASYHNPTNFLIECKAHRTEEECLTDPRCDWDKEAKRCHDIEQSQCAILGEAGVCLLPLRNLAE